MPSAHPTAVIDPQAEIAGDVEVGPYCVITGQVVIGSGCKLGAHCLVQGETVLGSNNMLAGHCSIGSDSQDKKFRGGGRLRIGSGNSFREFCVVNRATQSDGETVLGDDNLLMSYSHVGHECRLGSGCVLANAVQLGGHVSIADRAILGGAVLVHQHCRVGTLAIIGGSTALRQDVPPYASFTIADGRVALKINTVGLERAGMRDDCATIAQGYKVLYYRQHRLSEAVTLLQDMAREQPSLQVLADFVGQNSVYGLVRPRWRNAGSTAH